MTNLVLRKVINGGVLKLEQVQVICPACGQQVEAVATDGRVKGYCAVAKQYVDFLIETQRVHTDKANTAEARAKVSAAIKKRWQDPEYRAKQIAALSGILKNVNYDGAKGSCFNKRRSESQNKAASQAFEQLLYLSGWRGLPLPVFPSSAGYLEGQSLNFS